MQGACQVGPQGLTADIYSRFGLAGIELYIEAVNGRVDPALPLARDLAAFLESRRPKTAELDRILDLLGRRRAPQASGTENPVTAG